MDTLPPGSKRSYQFLIFFAPLVNMNKTGEAKNVVWLTIFIGRKKVRQNPLAS